MSTRQPRAGGGQVTEVLPQVKDLPVLGSYDADIVFVCDVPTWQDIKKTRPINGQKESLLAGVLKGELGIDITKCAFVSPCLPIDYDVCATAGQQKKHVDSFAEEFKLLMRRFNPKLIVTLGNLSAGQVFGKSIKITKARGTIHHCDNFRCPVLPVFAAAFVVKQPEFLETFKSDLLMVSKLIEYDYDLSKFQQQVGDYEWRDDISDILENKPKVISFDTETTGLNVNDPNVQVITLQMCFKEGHAICSNIHLNYGTGISARKRKKLVGQWRQILEDPSVKKCGHNIKFDHMMCKKKLNIDIKGWYADTLQLAFCVDENMREKSLDNCVKRWVKPMSGYADDFNATTDKSKMIEVPMDKMLTYGGGDVDATFRLAKHLVKEVRKDIKQWNCYRFIQLPAILAFANVVEPYGFQVDIEELRNLEKSLTIRESEARIELLGMIPQSIKQKHIDKGLKLSRSVIIQDVLFNHEEGFKLKPKVFTDKTKNLPEDQRIPAVGKDHLAYFKDDNEFVAKYLEYVKLSKMRGTYVGLEEKNTGFYKYLTEAYTLHPNYNLHKTTTGRSSCVHSDSLVLTDSGYKKIIDILPQDRVWTHKNRWGKVLHLITKPKQDMYDIVFSNGETLRCTEEHRILTDKGTWETLRDVYFKETLKRRETKEESSKSLRELLIDNAADSGLYESDTPHSERNAETRIDKRETSETESVEIFKIEARNQKPNEWQETAELQRGMRGWQRLLNRGGGRETVFCTPNSYGENSENTRKGPTTGISSTSYRREQAKQSPRQSSFSDKDRASGNTRKVSEEQSGVRITGVDFGGVHRVYDLTVEEDHSYLCAGVFNHNSDNPNGQNLPKRGKLAEEFRKIFVARPGYKIVECDLSQAELRLIAWVSQDPLMLDIYKNNGDIHTQTAATTMGITLEQFKELDPKEVKANRYKAKAVNFGYAYGMSSGSFKEYAKVMYDISLTEQQSEDMRNAFFSSYKNLLPWHKAVKSVCKQHKMVRALHGALRHLPSIDSPDRMTQSEAGRQAVNSPIQRFASDLALLGMVRLVRDADPEEIRPIGFIHDALVCEVKEERAQELASNIKFYMESNPLDYLFGIESPIPLLADAAIGPNLCDLEEQENLPSKAPDWWQSELDGVFPEST